MTSKHPVLKALLPTRFFKALEKSTRKWVAECSCGNCRDLWESGAVRFMASGEPRRLMVCPICRKVTLHTVRRKTPAELDENVISPIQSI